MFEPNSAASSAAWGRNLLRVCVSESVCPGECGTVLWPQSRGSRLPLMLRLSWRARRDDVQVQVSGIYTQTRVDTQRCSWHVPLGPSLPPHPVQAPKCVSLFVSASPAHRYFWLPGISSWPQSTAFCGGLSQPTSAHGTTWDRKGHWFSPKVKQRLWSTDVKSSLSFKFV